MIGRSLPRKTLEESHYVRKASSHNYWFDFSIKLTSEYRVRTSGDFCFIVTSSDDLSDAYILPYAVFGPLFEESEPDQRGRWIGTIVNDIVKIHSSGKTMFVGDYHNKFELLDYLKPEEERNFLHIRAEDERGLGDLIIWLSEFNERFKDASPQRKMILSEKIARPGKVSNALRKLRNNACQLCHVAGFKSRNGGLYSEVHHIVELHKVIPGSLCSENLIVVCPTCHKKLHYANVEFRFVDSATFEISFDQHNWVQVTRNLPTAFK